MALPKWMRRLLFPHSYSEAAYIRYLRRMGAEIGQCCQIPSPNQTHIDPIRLHMLHIGDYVTISRNVTILSHDYSRKVVAMALHEYIGEAPLTWIGNNVFLGVNVTILPGAHIGDNCIIGAGAVVRGHFPDNTVIAGNPAVRICTLEAFAEKRRGKALQEAVQFVKRYRGAFGREPTLEEMGSFYWLYLPRARESIQNHPRLFHLKAVDMAQYQQDFLSSSPLFPSYEAFLAYARQEILASEGAAHEYD